MTIQTPNTLLFAVAREVKRENAWRDDMRRQLDAQVIGLSDAANVWSRISISDRLETRLDACELRATIDGNFTIMTATYEGVIVGVGTSKRSPGDEFNPATGWNTALQSVARDIVNRLWADASQIIVDADGGFTVVEDFSAQAVLLSDEAIAI